MINLIPEPQIMHVNYDEVCKLERDSSILLKMETQDFRILKLASLLFPKADIKSEYNEQIKGYYFLWGAHNAFDAGEYYARASRNTEGYYLNVASDSVVVYSDDCAGFFYGLQTLRQLIESDKPIPLMVIIDWSDISLRGMNIDLRQVIPKFDNMLLYIEEFAKNKANLLLIEYEDKFPFQINKELRHTTDCFTEEQIERIKQTAYDNFIELVPLQQTFGHLEYLLKHEKYKHLREREEAVGELCPQKPDSLKMALSLLDEIIEAHPDSKYVHIGCDEIWCLCTCDDCRIRFGDDNGMCFIDYVNKIIAYTADRGKVPIIWHDMLTKCSDEAIKTLDSRAEVMLWLYEPTGVESIVKDLMGKMVLNGIKCHGASSVRCNDWRCDQNVPQVHLRTTNIREWTNLVHRYNIDSIISTNWGTGHAMSSSYGPIENSLYLCAFSAEKYWKRNSDENSFLARYMSVFHGVNIALHNPEYREKAPEDYYMLMSDMLQSVTKNLKIATLIRDLYMLEELSFEFFSIFRCTYRYFMFSDVEAEVTRLKFRYTKISGLLNILRENMMCYINEFMSDYMIELFMNSRFKMIEYMHDNLYSKII